MTDEEVAAIGKQIILTTPFRRCARGHGHRRGCPSCGDIAEERWAILHASARLVYEVLRLRALVKFAYQRGWTDALVDAALREGRAT
jgi:hypothetical protein